MGGAGLAFQYLLPRFFARWITFPTALAQALSKSGPIVAVIAGTAIVAAFHLGARNGVNIIGEIPSELPSFALPDLGVSEFLPLFPLALTISFIGFLKNISVTKSLAAKRRQKVDSNQEFIALGAANLAAGVTGGLAAIIIIAVIGLMDFAMPRRLWRYNKADATARADSHVRRSARARGHERHPDRRCLDRRSPPLAHEPAAHGRRRPDAQQRTLSQRPTS